MLRSAALAFTLVISGSAGGQHVAPVPQASLRWSAPLGCPKQSSVQRQLSRRLAGSASQDHVRARGIVERHEDAYRLRLDMERPPGAADPDEGTTETRMFESASCDALAEVATWIVAFVVDPAVRRPLPDLDDVLQLRSEASSSESPGAGSTGSLYLSLGDFGDLGRLGRPTLGLRGTIRYGLSWRAGLSISWLPPRYVEADRSVGGGEVGAILLAPELGRFWMWPRVTLGAVLGVEGQLFHGRGTAISAPRSTLAVGLGIAVRAHLSLKVSRPVYLQFEAGPVFGVVRPRFVVEDLGEIYRVPAVGAEAVLAVKLVL